MTSARQSQRGLTLVELLVGLAIGLVISLAAAALYLASNESSRSVKAFTDINETGKLALDTIGRELQKAGFFPAQYRSPPSDNVMGSFHNPKEPANAIFNYGLFGCDGGSYDPAAKACTATVAGAPDGLVINYFATPEFGAGSLLGNSNDCNRKPVSGDAANAVLAAASQPMYVSNRYGLKTVTFDSVVTAAGTTTKIETKALACHGNGEEAADAQAHFAGIEDMTIRYGVHSGAASQSPEKLYTAAEVTALPVAGGLQPWQRVTAVKICIVVRSLENARTEEKTGSERTYRDCRGNDVKMTDRLLYKRFERVYAVRNHLTGTM
jgi:type IV pilus assembly protein PilW